MVEEVYYFGAGPAALPKVILKAAQADLMNWQQMNLSILEVGHRTQAFTGFLEQATQDLKALLSIPDNYKILFLGGAARTQFAMIPLNLMTADKSRAGYICSGFWSTLAFEEAKRFGEAYVLPYSEPDLAQLIKEDTAYIYYTPNETIDGVRLEIPDVGDVPLVADMTSCLLSEPLDISRFGLIFAGAQKNIGPAGLTVVIVREDLFALRPKHIVPTMLDYRIHAKHGSLYATPPVFQCDMAAKMFQWIKAQGGVQALYQVNLAKAAKLYAYIDASPHYQCLVDKKMRSIMNVCFSMVDSTQEAGFLNAAETHGLLGLKGHRLKGGLRASLYNAMPMAGVDALITFMDAFVAS